MAKSSRKLWTAALSDRDSLSSQASSTREATAFARKLESRKPFTGTILGIDPSLRASGLAVIRFEAGSAPQLVFSQTVKPPQSLNLTECLPFIARAVRVLLTRYTIDTVALEQPIFVQNFRTALILGSARGAFIATVGLAGLDIHEYAPLRIKKALTGMGKASKEQVAAMVKSILQMDHILPLDESDAAAVALCHAWTSNV